MIFLPFLISFLTGILLVEILFAKDKTTGLFLKIILGTGLGLGLSSHIVFYSFLFLDHLSTGFIFCAHVLLLLTLIVLLVKSCPDRKIHFSLTAPRPAMLLIASAFVLVAIFVIKQGERYPHGGWDAWQVWNFKAKFLFLSSDHWKDIFSPQLWRSSPHYPLLLPLINVWGWLFTGSPVDQVPFFTSLIFTFLTAGLLMAALRERTGSLWAFVPGFLILTLPLFNLLATSQYCDIVLSYYLLASITTLTLSRIKKSGALCLISGIMAGLLGFTKPEGLIASMIVFLIALTLSLTDLKKKDRPTLPLFFIGLAAASLPTLFFQTFYSPGNQTFINGLISTGRPSDLVRLQAILDSLGRELHHGKWNGIWFLILAGILAGWKKPWQPENIISGVFLFLYFGMILFYYEVNTYFEIKWWLSVSLDRILFSLLPLSLFWVFQTLFADKK